MTRKKKALAEYIAGIEREIVRLREELHEERMENRHLRFRWRDTCRLLKEEQEE
jgi:hypothetical protein